jgi:malate synthase
VPGHHQIDRELQPPGVTAADLLQIPTGSRTEVGLRQNIRVGIQYVEAWLRGMGAVPLYNLMEDAATAEISRTQVWQWIRHQAALDDGTLVSTDLVHRVVQEEMEAVRKEIGAARFDAGRFDDAIALFETLVTAETLPDFLTSLAYGRLDDSSRGAA